MTVPATQLGIDIGATRIKGVLVNSEGVVLRQLLTPSVDEQEGLTNKVKELIESLAPEATTIGICAPGIAARDHRSIAWMQGRMEVVEGFDWSEFGLDAWVLNDAQAATLAEAWTGAARGKQHVLLLTLGTGVGGGVLIDGKLYAGSTGRAGHLGHVTVDAWGKQDIVGLPGSLEDAIGDHSLRERSAGRFSTTQALVVAVRQQDREATIIWQKSVTALATSLASLINTFDPEIIVLGGGIAEAGSTLFEPLAREMERVEWRPWGEAVPIAKAVLGDIAGAIGAARFAFSQALEES